MPYVQMSLHNLRVGLWLECCVLSSCLQKAGEHSKVDSGL